MWSAAIEVNVKISILAHTGLSTWFVFFMIFFFFLGLHILTLILR